MKQGTVKIFVAFICILFLSACGMRESLWPGESGARDIPYAQGTILVEVDKDAPEPPGMTVTAGSLTFGAMRGSYCWSSGGHGVCADKSSLRELAAKQSERPAAASGDSVQLRFDKEPSELRITAYYAGNEHPGQAIELGDSRSFELEGGGGRHLYVVDANWPEGSSSYVFWVMVGQPGGKAVSEQQAASAAPQPEEDKES